MPYDLHGSSSARGYGARWQRARRAYLQRNPLCAECMRQGKATAATVVDHIQPHKGDEALFWSTSNWQPLCKRHHDQKTATTDRVSSPKGHDPDGFPTHAGHSWREKA